MTAGYAGKILRIDLTKKSISTIDTEQYEEYGGGHGIGSAIFWDLAGSRLPFSALDPANVVTIMTSPFSGVVVPAATGRCEVQGVGPQPYPMEWFTRSNFGGRFSSQLKYAGWDGIVIESAVTGADDPVWINIINDKVTIESAKTLWGLDTIETQEEIWRRVVPGLRFGEWLDLQSDYTTQKPYYMPVCDQGKWSYAANTGRVLNKQKSEEWKTRFYEFEGWNAASGWPKSSTLESLGLKKVADKLKSKGRLG